MCDRLIIILLSICMASFLAVWKFTTPYTTKDYMRDILKFRSLVFTAAQVLMFIQLLRVPPFLYAQGPALSSKYIGVILAIIGASLAIWAKLTMKESWGPPAQHQYHKQNKLITTGPFAYTRNPIYIGLLLYYLGFELALGSLLALLVIPFSYLFYRAVLVEEKLLAKHFGKEFTTYASRVRRFL